MPNIDELQSWHGRDLIDRDGDKIGSIGNVYIDDETGQPEWLTVKTGLFGMRESFVPTAEARAEGDTVRVPYEKSQVKDAPNVDADGALSHGGGVPAVPPLRPVRRRADSDRSAGRHRRRSRGPRSRRRGPRTADRDVSGPADRRRDDALGGGGPRRHHRRETGRARLRKYVVTENVTRPSPSSARRSASSASRSPAPTSTRRLDGPAISEEEHEVTLHAEEPVVEKRTVPKERVRMDTRHRHRRGDGLRGGAQGAHRARGRLRPRPPVSGALETDPVQRHGGPVMLQEETVVPLTNLPTAHPSEESAPVTPVVPPASQRDPGSRGG